MDAKNASGMEDQSKLYGPVLCITSQERTDQGKSTASQQEACGRRTIHMMI